MRIKKKLLDLKRLKSGCGKTRSKKDNHPGWGKSKAPWKPPVSSAPASMIKRLKKLFADLKVIKTKFRINSIYPSVDAPSAPAWTNDNNQYSSSNRNANNVLSGQSPREYQILRNNIMPILLRAGGLKEAKILQEKLNKGQIIINPGLDYQTPGYTSIYPWDKEINLMPFADIYSSNDNTMNTLLAGTICHEINHSNTGLPNRAFAVVGNLAHGAAELIGKDKDAKLTRTGHHPAEADAYADSYLFYYDLMNSYPKGDPGRDAAQTLLSDVKKSAGNYGVFLANYPKIQNRLLK